MNRILLALTLCLATQLWSRSQEIAAVDRGADFEVTQTVSQQGETPITNRWTRLQAGLNRWSAQQQAWVASSNEIELTPGGAEFRKGAFHVAFPPDPTEGPLVITLPDNRIIRARTIGIAMRDPSTGDTVWIGQLRSTEGELIGQNEIVYPNAFTGIRADIRVTVEIDRLRSDVVFREQAPSPADFGFGADARLEVWHDLLEAPQVEAHPATIHRQDGSVDNDVQLDFGRMHIGQGTAFLVGEAAGTPAIHGPPDDVGNGAGQRRIPVAKEVFFEPQTQGNFLIESVPFPEAEEHLRTLPPPAEARLRIEGLKERLEAARSVRGRERRRPLELAVAQTPSTRRIASISRGKEKTERGFLLDYTLVAGIANFTFANGTTYYVDGDVSLTGTTTIEGGAVVKFAPYTNQTPVLKIHGPVVCKTRPYLPAIFTAKDDNSVGEIITGSTGTPAGYYAWYNLFFTSANSTSLNIHDIITRFAQNGLGMEGTANHRVMNIQAVNCYKAFQSYNNTVAILNFLSDNCLYPFHGGNTTINAEHVTAHNATRIFHHGGTSYLNLKNSLLVGMASGSTNVTQTRVENVSSDVGVFARVGSGAHYLAAGSPYRNRGSTEIDAELSASFAGKTTYPPILLPASITSDTTLRPVVHRDATFPDLGFHYDAIDYAAAGVNIDNATLTLKDGVTVTVFKDEGFYLKNNGKLFSEGRPDAPNRIFRYTCVQGMAERWDDPGHAQGWSMAHVRVFSSQAGSEILFRHTDLPFVADTWAHRMVFNCNPYSIASYQIQNSWIEGGYTTIVTTGTMATDFRNNLFRNCYMNFEAKYNGTPGNLDLDLHNNTHLGGSLIFNPDNTTPNWTATDNAFALNPTHTGTGQFSNSHNGYTGAGRLTGHQNSVSFASAPYGFDGGRYYLPSGSPLIDAGSNANAANAGYYHYTTRSTQSKEGSSALDIGVHYAALLSGVLSDSDGDGIPDVREDTNSNGAVDQGETNFAESDTDADGAMDLEEIRAGTSPTTEGVARQRRLAYWSFNEETLKTDRGEGFTQQSLDFLEAPGGTRFAGSAIRLENDNAPMTPGNQRLCYKEIGANGLPNFSRAVGTLRFWFRPDWLANGSGLPTHGRLVSLGAESVADEDWWNLEIHGNHIFMMTEADGARKNHFDVELDASWNTQRWHEITVTYDANGVKLYIDGEEVHTSSVAPVSLEFSKRMADFIAFGNAPTGGAGANGLFDEIETFNYPLTEVEIQRNYRQRLRTDDDHDNLANLVEVDESGSNPLDADTDDDGMSDGWEHRWNKVRDAYDPNLTLFNLHSDDSAGDFDNDNWTNLEEYRLGLNPYNNDDPATPLQGNTAGDKADLINIAFGTGVTGMAAAGVDSQDSWNSIGPLASEAALSDAAGNPTGAKITLLMNLGHGTRFTVTCASPEQENFCAWLGITNAWQNIFCCTNDSAFPEREAHFFCLHSQTGEALILTEQPDITRYGNGYDLNAFHPSSPDGRSVAVGGAGIVYRSMAPDLPWIAQPGAFGNSHVYHDLFSYLNDFRTPITTARTLVFEDWYVERAPGSVPPASPRAIQTLINISVTPGMEEAWVTGFDKSGTHSGSGLAASGVLHSYAWNSMDSQLSAQPQSMDCNDFWFTRDGHGVIKVGPLEQGDYRIYLYAAKPGQLEPTTVEVNGQSVSIPYVGATGSQWREDSNFETVTVSPDSHGMIEFHFESGKSLINGMQLMRLPRIVTFGAVTTVYDESQGIKVTWPPIPGVRKFKVYRQVATSGSSNFNQFHSPESPFPWLAQYCQQIDHTFPFDYNIRYRVAALDDFDRELAYEFSNSINVAATEVTQANHAPTLQRMEPLHHTYKDTPFLITSSQVRQASDAHDFDGDRIYFEITDVLSGKLKVTVGETTTTINAGDTITVPPILNSQRIVQWLPPDGEVRREVPAFKVRATDGALLSAGVVEVKIEVRDIGALAWWGYGKSGFTGNGVPMDDDLNRGIFLNSMMGVLNRESTIDPEALRVDADEVEEGSDRRLFKVNALSIQHPDWTATRAAVAGDGSVWTWGFGHYGQLGNGVAGSVLSGPELSYLQLEAPEAVKVDSLSGVTGVAVGDKFMVAVRSDGTVWGWGYGENGNLGVHPDGLPRYLEWHGYHDVRYEGGAMRATPNAMQIPGLRDIVSVAAVGSASFAVNEDGELFQWGTILESENTYEPRRIFVPGRVTQITGDVNKESYLAVNDLGEVFGWGNIRERQPGFASPGAVIGAPEKLDIEGVVSISAHRGHTVALMRDGTVKHWGSLDALQVPTPVTVGTLRNIVKVSTSGNAAVALDVDGNVWGWGRAGWGIFGFHPAITDRDKSDYSQLSGQARTALWLSPRFGFFQMPIQIESLEKVEDIAISMDGAFAVTAAPMGPARFSAIARNVSVDLSWRRVPGAASYEVHRRGNHSDWNVIATIADRPDIERVTWTDSAVQNHTHYEYRVRGLLTSGPGDFSRTVEAVPDVLPGAVEDFSVVPSIRQAHLIWAPVINAIGYEIWRKKGSESFLFLTNLVNVNPIEITLCDNSQIENAIEAYDLHLDPNESYEYKIRSLNQIGAGEFSEAIVINSGTQATGDREPGTPDIAEGSEDAVVTWANREEIDPEAGYLVEIADLRASRTSPTATPTLEPVNRRVVGGPRVPSQGTELNRIQIGGLLDGRKYRIYITEFSLCDGEGTTQEEDFATPRLIAQPPNNGITYTYGGRNIGVAYARWQGDAVSYMVELRDAQDDPTQECSPALITIEPDQNGVAEFFQAGLDPGEYKLKIHTIWEDYTPALEDTNEVDIVVLDAPESPQTAPQLPAIVGRPANNRIRLTWWGLDDSRAFEETSDFRNWRFFVQRKQNGVTVDCLSTWTTDYEGYNFGLEDEEVVNSASYTYRIFGISPGAQPEVRFAQAGPFIPASTYSGQTITINAEPLNSAVELTWTGVVNGSGVSQEYEVVTSAFSGGPYWTVAMVPGNAPLRYIDTNVRNGETYYYRVYARSANGDSLESDEDSATPSTDAALLRPGPFIAHLGNGTVGLSWPEVPAAESYAASLRGATDIRTAAPQFHVALSAAQANSGDGQNYHFDISAIRRGVAVTTYATVVGWGKTEDPNYTLSHYSIRSNGTEVVCYTPPLTDPGPYAHVFDGTSSTAFNYTVHAVFANASANPPTYEAQAADPNAATTNPDSFSIAISNNFAAGIFSPTNVLVGITITDPGSIEAVVYGVDFFIDGALVETDPEPPYNFYWVNPHGTVQGTSHSLKARMVTSTGIKESATVSATVKIAPDLMRFQTTETDLQIPAPGLPLAATRSFDARDSAVGMLGKGWRFDWERAGMTVPNMATGWQPISTPSVLAPKSLEEAAPHLFEVRLPSGAIERFRPISERISLVGYTDYDDFNLEDFNFDPNLRTVPIYFAPVENSSGSLTEMEAGNLHPTLARVVLGDPIVELNRMIDTSGAEVMVMKDLRYSADGQVKFDFVQPSMSLEDAQKTANRVYPLRAIEDAAGNSIIKTGTDTDFYLDHSNQRRLHFIKTSISNDWTWKVYDPIGIAAGGSAPAAVEYKVVGNLLTEVKLLVDRTSQTYHSTKYEYDGSSRLLRVIAHDGVILLENGYNSDGLLTLQKGPMGLATTLTTPTATSGTIVEASDNSGLGAAARALYGPGGELIEAQAVGQVPGPTVGYDNLGRPAYQADQDGNYTSYLYDRAGRVTSTIDALGNQSFVSYDGDGNPVGTEDARGASTRYSYYGRPGIELPTDPDDEYNAEGMLHSVVDAEGTTTSYTYNRRGQVLSEKKVPSLGGVQPITRYEYTEAGDVEKVKEALWQGGTSTLYTTEYTYDANGNRLTEKRYRTVVNRDGQGIVGTPSTVIETIDTTFYYDARNRLIGTRNPLSPYEESGSLFSAQGKVPQSTNTLGQITSFLYDPRGNLIQTTYPDGTVSRTVYDARGRAEWTQERCVPSSGDTVGPATRTFYDSAGRVKGTKRYSGTTVNLVAVTTVNESGTCVLNENVRVKSGTSPSPSYWRTRIQTGNEGTVASSSRTQYDTLGRVEFSVDEGGGLTEFDYDELGRRVRTKRFPDYSANNDPTSGTSLTSPTGATVIATESGYDENGNQTWSRDPLGRVTQFVFDALNRQRMTVMPVVASEGRLTFVADDVADWPAFVARLRTHTDALSLFIYNYCTDSQSLIDDTDLDEGEWVTLKDALVTELNNLVGGASIYDATRFGGVSLNPWTTEAKDLVAANSTPDGVARLNQLLLADAYPNVLARIANNWTRKTTRTDYDGLGRRVAETDEAGVLTLFKYDALGRLIEVWNDPERGSQEGAQPVITRYEYDEVGNQRKEIKVTYTQTGAEPIEDTSRATSYEYDKLGRRVLRFLPSATSLNTVTTNPHWEKVTYATETATVGKTLKKEARDFRGETITYRYDIMDRLASKTLPAVNTFEVARTVAFAYTGALMTQVAETGTGFSRVNYYAYDALRRLEKKDTPEGVLKYGYNDRGSVASMKAYKRSDVTVNGSTTGVTPEVDVEYAYDGLARLKTVKNYKQTGSNGNVSTNYYDLAGNLKELSYPNTTHHLYDYTEQNRLRGIKIETHTTSGSTLYRHYDYTLAITGHRTGAIERIAGNGIRRSVQYNYDFADPLPLNGTMGTREYRPQLPRLYRLGKEVINPGTSAETAEYLHDILGNRTVRDNTGGSLPDQAFTYEDLNDRMDTSPSTFTYDANGNTKTSPRGTDYYDAENRLIKRTLASNPTITIGYDHDGNRVWKYVANGNGTYKTLYYLIDDRNPTGYTQVVLETVNWTSSPTPATSTFFSAYEWGHSLITQRYHTGGIYYMGADAQRSIRFVMGSNGNIVTTSGVEWFLDYDAYGNLLNTPAITIDMHYGYAGESRDVELGMYNNRARYYSPEFGRFWTMDSFEGSVTDPNTLQKYIYCHSDPINSSDPTGHFEMSILGITMNISIRSALQTGAAWAMRGAIVGGTVGAIDAALQRDADIVSIIKGFEGGVEYGAIFGPAAGIKLIRPILMLYGLYKGGEGAIDSYRRGESAQALFRAGLALTSGVGGIKEAFAALRKPGLTRVPQDIARETDFATPPAANGGAGTIGSTASQTSLLSLHIRIAEFLRARDIRVNQEQVSAKGVRVGRNKPDLQFTLFGRRIYIEYDRSSSGRGAGHSERTRANDPDGAVLLFIRD